MYKVEPYTCSGLSQQSYCCHMLEFTWVPFSIMDITHTSSKLSPSCLLLLSIWLKSSELSSIENLFQSGWSIKSNYYILLRRYKKEIPVLLLCFTHKCLSQSLYHFNSYRLKRMCEEFGTAEHLFHN